MLSKKAIISAGGFGTRLLPITKSLAKCMLPILGKPLVHYLIEECITAGVRDIAVVIPPGLPGEQVKHYLNPDPATEAYLQTLEQVQQFRQAAAMCDIARFTFIHQPRDGRYGTAVPLLLARQFIAEGEFFYLLNGDDFVLQIDGRSDLLDMQGACAAGHASAALGSVTRDASAAISYAVLHGSTDEYGRVVLVDLDDKPTALEAGQYQIGIGRMLLHSTIIPYIDEIAPSPRTGEYQLTDALNSYAVETKVIIAPLRGEYYDCGAIAGWVRANLAVATHSGILCN